MSQLSNKEFNKLKREWYKKLKQSGFEDIEDANDKLKDWTSARHPNRRGEESTYFESKRNYYILASQFYHEHNFSSDLDKIIWKLHSEGQSARRISKVLESLKIMRKKTVINDSIRRNRDLMLQLYGVK